MADGKCTTGLHWERRNRKRINVWHRKRQNFWLEDANRTSELCTKRCDGISLSQWAIHIPGYLRVVSPGNSKDNAKRREEMTVAWQWLQSIQWWSAMHTQEDKETQYYTEFFSFSLYIKAALPSPSNNSEPSSLNFCFLLRQSRRGNKSGNVVFLHLCKLWF